MKGLRKYLAPFAPDQSGAVSVLYELGSLLAIVDAGGCTGNVCGFDEPRWFTRKSAIFSAGLRDMDAILGRDEKLVEKMADAEEALDVQFAAIIGTPVPAVIGTDYRALKQMLEKRTGLPVLTVDTDGTRLYDSGAEKAYLALFQTFATEKQPVRPGRIGVLGATPQDLSDLCAPEKIRAAYGDEAEVICYGMGSGLDEVREASAAEKNLVVAPCALQAAQYLKQTFGIPYEVGCPLAAEFVPDETQCEGKRVLVVHQQVMANSIREELLRRGAASVTVASWFRMDPALSKAGDVSLAEEEDLISLASGNAYDVIIADPLMERMIPDFTGLFVPAVHFAVSGKLVEA